MSALPDSSSARFEAAAAAWIARRDGGLSVAEQAELEHWLRDSRHADAFARCAATWDALPKLKALPPERIAAMTRSRRRRGRLAPVIALAGVATAIAAALVLALFMPFNGVVPSAPLRVCVAPADAEARVAMEDGSVIIMRRGSRVEILDGSDARRVRLMAGEAQFTVTHDPHRPFFVYAAGMVVRDIGTVFDVRLHADDISVLVSEGKVALRPSRAVAAATPTSVVAGQRAVATLGREDSIAVGPADPAEMREGLAWKSRRLSFARTPLTDAIAEINRYNVEQLVIRDPSIASLLLAGSVQSDNLDGFLRMLETGFDVTAERKAGTISLVKAR